MLSDADWGWLSQLRRALLSDAAVVLASDESNDLRMYPLNKRAAKRWQFGIDEYDIDRAVLAREGWIAGGSN